MSIVPDGAIHASDASAASTPNLRSSGLMLLAQKVDEKKKPAAAPKAAGQQQPDQTYSSAADAEKDCGGDNADARIKGCTYLIEKAKLPSNRLASALAVRGYAYLVKQDRNHAILDFDASLKAVPDQVQVYYFRGMAYRLAGDYKRAIEDLTKAITLDPKSAGRYADRGTVRAANGEADGALADFAKAIELAPNEPFAYAARGALYAGQGKDDLALADYNKAVALNPKDAGVLHERGSLLLSIGENEKAIADFNQSINIRRDWTTSRDRAVAYAVVGNYASALADLDALVKTYSTFAEAYRIRAAIQEKLQRYDLALADFGKLLEINQSDVDALVGRGRLLAVSGKAEQGLADVEKAVTLAPDRPNPYLARAFVFARLKRSADALKDVDVAIALDPMNAGVRIDSATVLSELGEQAGAIANLSLALGSAPKNAPALEKRCQVYALTGDKARALADCQKALAIRPSVDGYLQRSRLQTSPYLAIRDLDRALKLNPDLEAAKVQLKSIIAEATKTIAAKPDSADAYGYRGWAELTLGQRKEASTDLAKAAELKSSDGRVYLGLGVISELDGKAAEAAPFYDKAIALDPALTDAYAQRGMLRANSMKYGDALLDLAEVVRTDPERRDILDFTKRVLFATGMTMRLQPNNVSLVIGRAAVYAAAGDFDAALADLNKADTMTPGSADVLFRRAQIYQQKGDRSRAIADLEKAQAADPNNARIKNLLEQVRKSGG